MSVIEEILKLSRNGCDNALFNYICENCDESECELNGEEYKEPTKHNHNLCIDCNMEKIIDYQKSTLVCKKCGLCEYYPVYVASYNHTIQPLRGKCVYKRSNNFKVIVRQFFYGGQKLVPDDVMEGMKYTMELIYCTTTPYQ